MRLPCFCRILDPILAPLAALQMAAVSNAAPEEPPWGVFLKDYVKCEW